MTSNFFPPAEHLRSKSLCNILADERMGLSFTIAAGPRQRSYSHVRVPRDSWPYFTASDSTHPSTWRARSPYLYPQEDGGAVTPPGTGFPFRRILRLAGLWWRYSNRLHKRSIPSSIIFSVINPPGTDQQKTPFPNNTSIVAWVFVSGGRCLPSRCL
jgi:hypothetical protein